MKRTEQLGMFTLHQSPDVFPLGGDSLALGRFADVRRGERVCDLGCGSGVLGLLLLSREASLNITGIELNPDAAALARKNFSENALSAQILEGDLRRIRQLLGAGSFDLVISNPPYFPVRPDVPNDLARTQVCCTLEQLCGAAAWLLKNGGRFALVHRPEQLCDLFCALRAHSLEPKRLQFIRSSPDRPPSAVLLECRKQGGTGLSVLPDQRM